MEFSSQKTQLTLHSLHNGTSTHFQSCLVLEIIARQPYRKYVPLKHQRTGLVVHSNIELAFFASIHNELFNLVRREPKGFREATEGHDR